jgi:hypothetical protein
MRRMKKGVFLGTVDEIGNERVKGGQLVLERRVVKITSVSGKSLNELYFDLKITNSSLDGIKEIALEDKIVKRPNKVIYDISIGGTKYQMIQVLRGLHASQPIGENGDAKVVSFAERCVNNFIGNTKLLISIKLDLSNVFTSVYAFGRICDAGNVTNAESMIVSCSTYESVEETKFSDKVYHDMISILKYIHVFYEVGIHFDECCLTNTLKSNGILKWDITAIRLRIIQKSEEFTLALSKIIDINNLLFNNVYFLNSIKVQSLMDVDFDCLNKILKAQTGCVGIPNWKILEDIEFMTDDNSIIKKLDKVLADDAIVDQYTNDVSAVKLEEVYRKLTDVEFLPSMMRSIIAEYNNRANSTGKSIGLKPLMFFGRQLFIRIPGNGVLSLVPLLLEAVRGKLKLYTFENGSNKLCDSLSSPTILCDKNNNAFVSNQTHTMFHFTIHDNHLIATASRLNFSLHKITVKIAVNDDVIDADSGEMSGVSVKHYDAAHAEEISHTEAGIPSMYSTIPDTGVITTEDGVQYTNPQINHSPQHVIYENNMASIQPGQIPVATQIFHPTIPVVRQIHPIPFDPRIPVASIHPGMNPQMVPNPRMVQVIPRPGQPPYIVQVTPQNVPVGPPMARAQAITIDQRYTTQLILHAGDKQYKIFSSRGLAYGYSAVTGQYKFYFLMDGLAYEQPSTDQAMYFLNGSVLQPFRKAFDNLFMRILNGLYLQIGVRNLVFTPLITLDLTNFPLRLE